MWHYIQIVSRNLRRKRRHLWVEILVPEVARNPPLYSGNGKLTMNIVKMLVDETKMNKLEKISWEYLALKMKEFSATLIFYVKSIFVIGKRWKGCTSRLSSKMYSREIWKTEIFINIHTVINQRICCWMIYNGENW